MGNNRQMQLDPPFETRSATSDETSDGVATPDEDIEAYARILEDVIAGIKTGLASMTEMLESLQTNKSDGQRRLILFSAAAQNVNIRREHLQKTVELLIKGSCQMKAVCNVIGKAIHNLRGVFEEFMRNIWDKIKKFANKLRDTFWNLVSNLYEGVSAFISTLKRVLSGLVVPPMASVQVFITK
jgi:hypothetical protein